jgi:hypothetical protein
VKRATKTYVFAGAALILSLTSVTAIAGKNHYRWIDDRGNPVHSDRPPPKGIDYEVISTGSSMVREVDAEEGAVPAQINPSAGNEFEQVETAKSRIEKNPEYCQRARENLATLNSAARIRLRDNQGELRYISEEEKEEQRQEAREMIAVHCED